MASTSKEGQDWFWKALVIGSYVMGSVDDNGGLIAKDTP